MSLLDNLGGNQAPIKAQSTPVNNFKLSNLNFLASLISGRGLNAKDIAINMLNQNSRLNGPLKEFLKQNGVTDEQLKSNGINL